MSSEAVLDPSLMRVPTQMPSAISKDRLHPTPVQNLLLVAPMRRLAQSLGATEERAEAVEILAMDCLETEQGLAAGPSSQHPYLPFLHDDLWRNWTREITTLCRAEKLVSRLHLVLFDQY